jgi:hypothetical protein
MNDDTERLATAEVVVSKAKDEIVKEAKRIGRG